MKIALAIIGQTDKGYLDTGVSIYKERIKKYVGFEEILIPEDKKWRKVGAEDRKKLEAKALLGKLERTDIVILLDEKGKEYTSVGFSEFLQKKMNGFDTSIYQKFPQKIALSKLTFSHQMVRLFVLESIYRAFTILNNEPYHNS